jgi:hypothetical protein
MRNVITWRPAFTSILLTDDMLVPVNFEITLKMEIVSEVFEEQDIALERIQTVVESFFGGSLICTMNEFAAELPYAFSNNVVAVPCDPTDHILCGLLFTKCNAVAEGKIIMQEVRIVSSRGSGLEYSISNEHPLPTFLQSGVASVAPWFLRSDTSFTDSFQLENKNIIEFPLEYCSWEEMELNWDRNKKTSTESKDTDIIDFKSIMPKNAS